jgi:hypothetical protein
MTTATLYGAARLVVVFVVVVVLAGLSRTRTIMPLSKVRHPAQDGVMPPPTVLLTADDRDSGRLIMDRARPRHGVVARVLAPTLDRQLAAGRAPESNRFLALRAQKLVTMATRSRLARDWQHLVTMAHRGPGGLSTRASLCRERIVACESEVVGLIESLLTPYPTSARGVAMASLLLSDGTGPLFNRRSATELRPSLQAVMAELDPSAF